MHAWNYRGNIPPWHTQNMGPEIAEEQDPKRWLLQEWNIPKHSLQLEFERIVPQSIVSVQSLHRHNTMSHSQSFRSFAFGLI